MKFIAKSKNTKKRKLVKQKYANCQELEKETTAAKGRRESHDRNQRRLHVIKGHPSLTNDFSD
jgi:hypothetical protein